MAIVDINRIKINTNRRPANSDKVAELVESIRANGLINPITLDGNYNLVAGLHRLTAYQSLGYEQIECKIIAYEDINRARLAEIDENLIRNELNAIERAELWLERDRILEQLGLRAKPGDNQYRQRGSETVSPPLKTTSELAKEVGYTERTYQHGKQIARDINSEVKEQIKGTPIAKSPSALLKIARAGSHSRQEAERAEKAAKDAKAQKKLAECERQEQLAAQAREKQKQLQLATLESANAEKQAKQNFKRLQRQANWNVESQPPKAGKSTVVNEPIEAQIGDEWLLKRHLIYCGDTTGKYCQELLPSHAALAIALPDATWKHDYLIDKANVVAVMRSEGYIHDFCRRSRMPLRYEFVLGRMYVAICSHAELLKPNHAIEIEGTEAIVGYLINLYTKPGNFVVAPSLGQGEVLINCERLERICFSAEENLERVNRNIHRWQQWTGQQAERSTL
jgi:ParB family transcriptional regulator, chromosome partitioning protein